MANKHNSSTVYPFVEGSNVRQGSGFSSLPSIVSSPTCSVQSMVTNISSQPDQLSYEVLVDDYPAPTLQGEILDDFTKWQTLYPKLLAVEEVWRKMENMASTLADSKIEAQAADVCMRTALDHVAAVMEAHHLLLDVVEYSKAGGKVKWILSMDGDLVFQGEAESKVEVLCAAFFEKQRRSLKHTPRTD